MLTVISFVKELQFSSTKLHCKLLFWWSVEWSASLWFIQDGILAIYSFPFKSWNVQNPIIFLCVKVNMSFHGRYFSSDPKLILNSHSLLHRHTKLLLYGVCVFQVCQMGKLLLALREATLVPDFNCRMHFSLLFFLMSKDESPIRVSKKSVATLDQVNLLQNGPGCTIRNIIIPS